MQPKWAGVCRVCTGAGEKPGCVAVVEGFAEAVRGLAQVLECHLMAGDSNFCCGWWLRI
ncbi:Lrp/AsnC ligand binding domain-containing protein [Uruburuella testudinis]|uniref:Lrp/AsnC ligand binding domain-containing protein n=1 Tax=Uruburuella testudinis TaxID=1282863 RepID=A0ABY4DV63_9NEIS|nr:Lrp/AsnC ligand binding domain-containing protein [Uruburuella testudinis]UOO82922.1 Lrp/AsnC ligand binding domain-containing protein [Uruburuella testudinis]